MYLHGVVCEAPRLIEGVLAARVSAVVVAAHQLHLVQVVREEEVPRLARVAGLGYADRAPVVL